MQQTIDDDGRKRAEFFRINFSRCILCGFCEEACPTYAIQITPDVELAEYDRQNLVYEKLFIKGDILLKSMYFFIFFATINGDSGWIFYSYRKVLLGLIFCYLINFFLKSRRI